MRLKEASSFRNRPLRKCEGVRFCLSLRAKRSNPEPWIASPLIRGSRRRYGKRKIRVMQSALSQRGRYISSTDFMPRRGKIGLNSFLVYWLMQYACEHIIWRVSSKKISTLLLPPDRFPSFLTHPFLSPSSCEAVPGCCGQGRYLARGAGLLYILFLPGRIFSDCCKGPPDCCGAWRILGPNQMASK